MVPENKPPSPQFRSLLSLSKWVTGIFVVDIGVTVFAILFNYAQADMASGALHGLIFTPAQASANESRQFAASMVSLALLVLAFAILLIWMYRANKNLNFLRAGRKRFAAGWAVACFFIPVVDLILPYFVMMEIRKGSDPGYAGGQEFSHSAAIAGWWWFALFLYQAIGYFSFWFFAQEPTPSATLAAAYTSIVSDIFGLVWMGLTILVVKETSEMQEARYGQILGKFKADSHAETGI